MRIQDLEVQLAASQTQHNTLQDSLFRQIQQEQQLETRLSNMDQQLQSSNQSLENLQRNLSQKEQQIQSLEYLTQELQSKVDSLEEHALPADNASEFIREQWARLGKWEKELKALQQSNQDQEKLLAQRTKFLDSQKSRLDQQEAQLEDLQTKEDELKIREQKLQATQYSKEPLDPGTISIRESKVVEFGFPIPVFTTETKLDYATLQTRAVAFMLKKGYLLDQKFPDLLFEQVIIPEIAPSPIRLRIRIEENIQGSLLMASFEFENGGYLDSSKNKKQVLAAREWVSQMVRFNF